MRLTAKAMLILVVATLVMIQLLGQAASAYWLGSRGKAVEVQSNAGWQATDVKLRPRQRIVLKDIEGQWTINVDGRWFDAAGYPGYFPRDIDGVCGQAPMPDAQNGALIGRIGAGEPFLVGLGGKHKATQKGELELRMNDAEPCMADNGGTIDLRVQVRWWCFLPFLCR